MLNGILTGVLGVSTAYLVYSVICLYVNFRRARKIGIPCMVLPVSPINTFWIVFEPIIFFFIDLLPFSLGAVNYYGRRGWHFPDKCKSHLELGDAFALVTPREIQVYLCDASAIHNVFSRRQDFIRPTQFYQLLAVFGPNVSTVEWPDWQRQRKIVASPFNENTNHLVWKESLNQASDMISAWTKRGDSGATGLGRDTRTLALDVLATTGFRQSYKFRSSMEPVEDEVHTYRKSLATVMDNCLFIMLFPPNILHLSFVPNSWKQIGQAVDDFKAYMMKMLTQETELLSQGQPGTGNLMSSLVRASNFSEKQNTRGLTVQEILGNIYVINFAGHDTTANSLAYAILMLSAYPDVQEWIAEEIREILPSADRSQWDYNDIFPKLKRCYSILLETIRLFPPIMALPKYTNQSYQTLRLEESKKDLVLPPNTMITPSLLAAHTHPKYWSDDSLEWHPQRWVSKPSSLDTTVGLSSRLSAETFHEPPEGTYFPWSDGPQSCPGKKFSQVESVAVLACLFREHRVRIQLKAGEDFEKAQARILAVAEDSAQILLLRMRDADSTHLIWEKVAS